MLKGPNKSNVDAKTRDGWRALHFAAVGGHLHCIKVLLEEGGVNVNTPGPSRMTAVALAAAYGHQDVVEYLVDHAEAKLL